MKALPALRPVVGDLGGRDLHRAHRPPRRSDREAQAAPPALRRPRTRPSPRRSPPPRRRRARAPGAPPGRARHPRAATRTASRITRHAAQRTAQLGEHRFLRAQVLRGERPVQPLEQLALLLAEAARDHDVDHHAQIPAPAAAQRPACPPRAASAPRPAACPPAPRSRPCPPASGTSSVAPSAASGAGDVERRDQVIAFAHEALVLAHPHEHVQIARRGRPPRRRGRGRRAGCAGRRRSRPESRPRARAAPPCARGRGTRRRAAWARGRRRGRRRRRTVRTICPNGVRVDRLQLPAPAAALAGLDRRARLGAVAVAVLAALDRLVGDLHRRAAAPPRADRSRRPPRRRRPRAGPDRPPNAPPPRRRTRRTGR